MKKVSLDNCLFAISLIDRYVWCAEADTKITDVIATKNSWFRSQTVRQQNISWIALSWLFVLVFLICTLFYIYLHDLLFFFVCLAASIHMFAAHSPDQIIRKPHSRGRIGLFWPTDSISFDKFLLAASFNSIQFDQLLMKYFSNFIFW